MHQNHYLKDIIHQFRKLRELAGRAISQVTDKDFFALPDEYSNSIAIIIKHIAGNMRSRWRDFLTTDGEKPDRNRDSEFIIDKGDSRETLLRAWEKGWQCLFKTLEALGPDDLGKTVFIRTEPHTVVGAINRQLAHDAYHVGQIVCLARSLAGSKWQSLSIPRGMSEDFNAMMRAKKFENRI